MIIDFQKIKLEKIQFMNEKNINNNWKSIDVKYDNKKLEFITPLIYMPFGIENEYNNYILKLQFNGIKNNTNSDLIHFYNFIDKLEKNIIEYLKIDKKKFKSSICIKHNYDNLLKAKLNSYKKRINCKINSDNYTTIYEIPKKTWIKCILYIDKIIFNEEIYTCKFIIKEICV